MFRYRMERVRPDSTQTKQEVVTQYRRKVAFLWLSLFSILGGLTAAIAMIAYGSDMSRKNIPVAVKFMLTSVIHGWPPPDAAQVWRRDFKAADTFVWQYYALLGGLVTSILVLLAFTCVGCTFDEQERSNRTCCQSCGCADNNNNAWLWCYCYDPCPYTYRSSSGRGNCYCGNCGNCSGGGCGNCSGGCGGCSGGDCKGGGEALIVIVLIVIVIVLVSAIFVVIGYALRKWALFHDRMTDMLHWQQCELEGETVVLGMHESVRPLNEV